MWRSVYEISGTVSQSVDRRLPIPEAHCSQTHLIEAQSALSSRKAEPSYSNGYPFPLALD